MKKILNFIIKFISNQMLKNMEEIISLALLVLLVILIRIVPVDNFWNKILATCYIVAVIAFLVVLSIPKLKRVSAIAKRVLYCL